MKHFSTTIYLIVITLMIGLASPTWAQQNAVVWVQIEAQPTLAKARERAQFYAASLPDVNGFALGNGWYGIVLGPYTRSDAEHVLRVYRGEGSIPRDSYIAFSRSYSLQFWPNATSALNLDQFPPRVIAPAPEAAPEEPAVALTPQPETDETGAQARRSEAELNRAERETLQKALKWAGFYTSAIDGSFGRGTRSSMSDWQAANGYDATGILTTLQRRALLDQFNAVLKGMDLKLVQDVAAGIELKIPAGVVAFDKYDPPFAHYSATGDIDAQVLLISQEGNQNTLSGLYDIMQTLEIVPLNGPRERNKNSFRLIGEDGYVISQTEAWLENGSIKGFTLIWPAGDEDRRRRVLSEMQNSFRRLDGVLDTTIGKDENQRIDLLAGLEIRKPNWSRSGFFVDTSGTVVTTKDAVGSCARITLDDEYEAQVIASDEQLGVVILRPTAPLAPVAIAEFSSTVARLQSDVALGGYSYEGALGAPTVTFGTLADVRGLGGETQIKRLKLTPQPGDVGGPVLDQSGNLLGMLLPRPANGQNLPIDVSFAIDSATIREVLERAGMRSTAVRDAGKLAPEDLRTRATEMTVLVSCWK